MVPEEPMNPLIFTDALVNAFIASLQSDISQAQLKLVVNANNVLECSVFNPFLRFNGVEEAFKFSVLCDEIKVKIARSQKLQNYAEEQNNVYTANTNIVSKYKHDLVIARAWENEKANIQRKLISEKEFHDELENKIAIQDASVPVIRQNIQATKNRIEELMDKIFNRSIVKLGDCLKRT